VAAASARGLADEMREERDEFRNRMRSNPPYYTTFPVSYMHIQSVISLIVARTSKELLLEMFLRKEMRGIAVKSEDLNSETNCSGG